MKIAQIVIIVENRCFRLNIRTIVFDVINSIRVEKIVLWNETRWDVLNDSISIESR